MLSLVRRSWPFRRRPAREADREFRRSRTWFVLTYIAPVFVAATGLLVAGGALGDADRDGRWPTVAVGLAIAVAGMYWWWRHHQPIYEFVGTELWKGRRFVVDLADVDVVRVSNHRYRAPRSPLVGSLVIVHLVGASGGRSTRLLGMHRLDFDEQREFHAHLRSHGLQIEGDWHLVSGDVIEGTRRKR